MKTYEFKTQQYNMMQPGWDMHSIVPEHMTNNFGVDGYKFAGVIPVNPGVFYVVFQKETDVPEKVVIEVDVPEDQINPPTPGPLPVVDSEVSSRKKSR
jgi:hypothetical protein